MEILFFAFITIVVAASLAKFISIKMGRKRNQLFIPPLYVYTKKKSVMTPSELQCFRRLQSIVNDRYYVFPQVHVSSLLDHTVAKQNWRAALAKIQRKSVDFVLADKDTLETWYAIELDDATHDRPTRMKRDDFINEIFYAAKLPLVRLRDIQNMTDEEIIQKLKIAYESER